MVKGDKFETERERWVYLGTARFDKDERILHFNDGVEAAVNQCMAGPCVIRVRLDSCVEAISSVDDQIFLDKLTELSPSKMRDQMIRFFTANCARIVCFQQDICLDDDFDLELDGDLYVFHAAYKNDEQYRRLIIIQASVFDKERGLRYKELMN